MTGADSPTAPSPAAPAAAPVVEFGAAGEPIAGERESGDRSLVAPFVDGCLVGLVDGLGHGVDAAYAALRAVEFLAAHAQEPLDESLRHCHEVLRPTRGAVMSLAYFDGERSALEWVGVGNVEGVLVRGDRLSEPRRETLSTRGGVVGCQLPPLRVERLELARGDTLLFASDGVASGFREFEWQDEEPQSIADEVLARFTKGDDDASVLVVRYVGSPCRSDTIAVRDDSDVAVARRHARGLALAVGMDGRDADAVAIAVSEVARNIVVHATHGEVVLSTVAESGRAGVQVVARDFGPGIGDPAAAMEDGFSTARTLGLGLASARRLMDEFELTSTVGVGTTVVTRKWRR